MKAFPLYEGSYSVAADKKFIPFDPAKHDAKDRPASLFVYVQPFLVQTSSDLVLLDTGLGYQDENGELWLHENIRKAGFQPEDVSMVIMSHLHFDHSGGMMLKKEDKYIPAFPNAEYYIQENELKSALSKASKSYHVEMLEALQRSGNIHFISGDGNINSEISYQLTGAHSEFHQVITIKTGGETYFFGGDVVPEPEQVQRKFIAKYDLDGRKAMELRQQFGEQAAQENWICLFYHAKSKAMARLQFLDNTFSVMAVS